MCIKPQLQQVKTDFIVVEKKQLGIFGRLETKNSKPTIILY